MNKFNPKLSRAEQELLDSGCLAMRKKIDADLCPAVEAKTSPYVYQKYGCRGIACAQVNSRYYKEHYANKVAAAKKATKKVTKKLPAKKTGKRKFRVAR